eukprot:g77981.t1
MNINPAPTPTPTPADFWKTWTRVEKKAPAEDAQLVRVSAEFVGISLVDAPTANKADGNVNANAATWCSSMLEF